jgi:DNA-binding MarR family transcriptional regulator
VLTTIAAFDRLGKNGSGYWTSQNRIAEIVRSNKSHLSNILSDLRDWSYITSKINPDKRWFRIHRVIYTEEDFNCLEKSKSVHSQRNKSVHSQHNSLGKSVHSGEQISSLGPHNQFGSPPKKDSETNDLKNITIVPTIKRTIEEAYKGLRGQDCAEARSQMLPLLEAENYLANCEALAASSDRDALKFERPRIEQIADDACLPEQVNERAAKLLSRISTDN